MSKNVGVIICAAGASSRFGGKRNKPFVDVAGREITNQNVKCKKNDIRRNKD